MNLYPLKLKPLKMIPSFMIYMKQLRFFNGAIYLKAIELSILKQHDKQN